MTRPRLTIAIPTYNRAKQLDRQLNWAVNAIAGRWDEVELIVSDNASTDETPRICSEWEARSNGCLRVIRQPKNLGLIRNALFCLEQAQGRYAWIIGDDDVIFDAALDWVLTQLTSYSSDALSFLHLNVSARAGYDGEILQQRVYPFQEDRKISPGNALFEKCVEVDENWMLLITASIYPTTAAKAAIQRWPGIVKNMAFSLFLAGYAAAQGEARIRAEPSIIYPHHTGSHLRAWLKTVYHDIPEVYLRLLKEGYRPAFIRRRILSRAPFLTFMTRFPLDFIKSLRIYLIANRLR